MFRGPVAYQICDCDGVAASPQLAMAHRADLEHNAAVDEFLAELEECTMRAVFGRLCILVEKLTRCMSRPLPYNERPVYRLLFAIYRN